MTVSETSTTISLDFNQLEGVVHEAMQRLQVPGVAIGLIRDEQEYAAGFGVTSVENPLAVNTHTLFQIGSNTKTMTALATMRLVEQDKINLDAPVREYVKDLKLQNEEAVANVTVRELFTHRAGWMGDFFDDTGNGEDALAKYVANMAHIDQRAPRGELWTYNNASFSLAGRVIEAVTGQTYEAALKELVLDPLGMKELYFFPNEVMTLRFAAGHTQGEKGPEVARRWALPRSANAAGGISASVHDMLRYLRFWFGDGTTEDGTRLLSSESMAYMVSPLGEAGNHIDNMGLSWMLRDIGGVRFIQHGGGTNGHISALMYAPDQKFGLVILTNSMRGGELNSELTKYILPHYAGVEEVIPNSIPMTLEALTAYVGSYSGSHSSIEVNLSQEGLAMQVKVTAMALADESRSLPPPSPWLKLSFYAPDKAMLTEGAMEGQKIDFLRDGNGKLTWLRMGVRAFKRQATLLDYTNDFKQLCRKAQELMEAKQVPGVAVGLLYKGREYTAAFGVTSVDNPLPVTPDTLFQIGSTTKTVTATTAMLLKEMGKLDLDAPVRQYLPELKLKDEEAAANVKVRDLFTHTGGWDGDFFEDTGTGDDALEKYVAKMAHLEQITPTGTAWSYNNSALSLAGRVIEAVTGQTYEQAVKTLLFEPLGMTHSFFSANDVITYRYAVGHTLLPEGPAVLRPWYLARAVNPAGGISTNIGDQLKYARFHMGDGRTADGKRLLSKASLAYMHSPIVEAAEGDYMGLSWMLHDIPNAHIVRHGGSTIGQQSAFMLVPDQDFAFVSVTNADKGSELNHDLTEWVLKHFLNAVEPEPQPLTMSEPDLAAYAGVYKTIAMAEELSVQEGSLIAQLKPIVQMTSDDSPTPPLPPPFKLNFYAPDKVFISEGAAKGIKGEFARNADGKLTWFRLGGRIAIRQP